MAYLICFIGDTSNCSDRPVHLAKRPYLIVGVCADEDVDYKPRPTMTFDERLRIVDACGLVDETMRGPVPASNDFLKKMAIGLVVHGNDTSEENRRTWYSAAIELGIYREVPYTSNITQPAFEDGFSMRVRHAKAMLNRHCRRPEKRWVHVHPVAIRARAADTSRLESNSLQMPTDDVQLEAEWSFASLPR